MALFWTSLTVNEVKLLVLGWPNLTVMLSGALKAGYAWSAKTTHTKKQKNFLIKNLQNKIRGIAIKVNESKISKIKKAPKTGPFG